MTNTEYVEYNSITIKWNLVIKSDADYFSIRPTGNTYWMQRMIQLQSAYRCGG